MSLRISRPEWREGSPKGLCDSARCLLVVNRRPEYPVIERTRLYLSWLEHVHGASRPATPIVSIQTLT